MMKTLNVFPMRTLSLTALWILLGPLLWSAAAATEVFIPAAARAAGQAGTDWRHDVRLYNPNAAAASVSLQYIPRAIYSGDEKTVLATLTAGEIRIYENVLVSLFGITHTSAGAVRITANLPVAAETRIYNAAKVAQGLGTYGQRVPGIPQEQSIKAGSATDLLYIDNTADFRTNLGLMDTSGMGSTAVLSAFDGSGAAAGAPLTVTLGAYEPKQYDGILTQLGVAGTAGNYRVRVTVTAGSVIPYASQVDNLSGDPIYLDGSSCSAVCGNAVLNGFAMQVNNGFYEGYVYHPLVWDLQGGALVAMQDPTPGDPDNGDDWPAVYLNLYEQLAALNFAFRAAPYDADVQPIPLPEGETFDFSFERLYPDAGGQNVLQATWHFTGIRTCGRIAGTMDALVLALVAGYEPYAGKWDWEIELGTY